MTGPGHLMRAEIAEIPGVFARARALNLDRQPLPRAFYTIARGSSDAAANILAYEFMRALRLPMTSLPPSVFSVGSGVTLTDATVLLISQSGGSPDLLHSAKGARDQGARVIALVNQPNSPIHAIADLTLPIAAGPELAVPATKSVIGSIAAGMALLAAFSQGNAPQDQSLVSDPHPQAAAITSALLRANHVYVIGRDTGFGAAQELALKLKETCALHAEAYSSSEVLHGPLQLATNPLLVLILDTGQPDIQNSLNTAEARFKATGGTVFRLRPSDVGAQNLSPATAAALLLYLTYPIVLATALALGFDPDRPATLAKVTETT